MKAFAFKRGGQSFIPLFKNMESPNNINVDHKFVEVGMIFMFSILLNITRGKNPFL